MTVTLGDVLLPPAEVAVQEIVTSVISVLIVVLQGGVVMRDSGSVALQVTTILLVYQPFCPMVPAILAAPSTGGVLSTFKVMIEAFQSKVALYALDAAVLFKVAVALYAPAVVTLRV